MMWKKEYETGDPNIDKEHQRFVKLISQLKAMNTLTGVDRLMESLDKIEDYAKLHFSNEEGRMLKSQFPDMVQHQAAHQKLLKTFKHTRDEVLHDQESVYEVIDFLLQWFAFHSTGMDVKLANHLRNWGSEDK